MTDSVREIHIDYVDRIIALGLALIFLAAWARGSTSAAPVAPAAIAIVAGNDQSAPAGSALGSPLTVKVVDRRGNAVPNAVVQWSVDGDGTLAADTTVTDVNGLASDRYTLAASAGRQDVIATIVTTSVPLAAAFVEQAN